MITTIPDRERALRDFAQWVVDSYRSEDGLPSDKYIVKAAFEALTLAVPPAQEPVAWVDVKDRHEGPYEFHGMALLDSGKHHLYAAPPAQPAPRKLDIPPPPVDPLEVVYAEGWNAACDAFFGGLPPQEPLIVTVTQPAEPVQRLTDEQIIDIADSEECNPNQSGWGAKFDYMLFARAIESAIQPQWRDIESAPKDEVARDGDNRYAQYILVWHKHFSDPVRARWWWRSDKDACNFIHDAGFACFPTHWMPLPPAPKASHD
jgi:hypothetical protein